MKYFKTTPSMQLRRNLIFQPPPMSKAHSTGIAGAPMMELLFSLALFHLILVLSMRVVVQDWLGSASENLVLAI